MIENPTTKAVPEHARQQKPTKPCQEQLVICAERVTENGKNGVIQISAKLNGVDHDLHDDVATVMKQYFHGLLDSVN